MLKNYLLLALRNLRKQKVFTIINIAGLTVGIISCLMIFLFVQHEFSYDNFHKDGNNIYRVMRVAERNGSRENIPYLSPPYATALKNDYPDAIKRGVRIMPSGGLVSYQNTAFTEKRLYYADAVRIWVRFLGIPHWTPSSRRQSITRFSSRTSVSACSR